MQIIHLELSHSNFYCPATGEVIVVESNSYMNEDAKSLMGYWFSEVLQEPRINDKSLKIDWDDFVRKIEEETDGDVPDYEDLEKFLQEYRNPTWVVFAITNSGIGHGFYSNTLWFVIDLDTKKPSKAKNKDV